MSDQEKKRPRAQSARDAKKSRFYLLQIDDEVWWRCRRANLTTLFLEGIIPTPLIAAVDRLQDLRRSLAEPTVSDVDKLEQIKSSKELDGFTELMRRVAVSVVVTPRLTHDKHEAEKNPDVLWVGGVNEHGVDEGGDVDKLDLITVWRAVIKEAGVVTMSDDEATEFRTGEPRTDVASLSHGEGVRPETVVMVPHAGSGEDAPNGAKVKIVHH